MNRYGNCDSVKCASGVNSEIQNKQNRGLLIEVIVFLITHVCVRALNYVIYVLTHARAMDYNLYVHNFNYYID